MTVEQTNLMQRSSNDAKTIELFQAERQADGSHSSERFVELLRRGELLRVRRGSYVGAQDWAEAPPWRRYDVAVAAVAMSRRPVFCRETALVLHGLPLLKTPRAVCVRTTDPGAVMQQAPPAMTGKFSPQNFRRRYGTACAAAAPLSPEMLSNVPTKLIEAACPDGVPRTELRRRLRAGEVRLPEVHLPSHALAHVRGPEAGYRCEPVALAVIDTVCRMSFFEAVVVLDAVKARGDVDLGSWMHYLRSHRQRARWQQAWSFADGRAESALESESRVMMAQVNCPAPTLQRVVRTHLGEFRADFCWEREGVLGEVDGKAKYFHEEYTRGVHPAELHYREKQRREALESQGWRVVRWGKAELRNPRDLIARLRSVGLL
jgi:hypothetical protein